MRLNLDGLRAMTFGPKGGFRADIRANNFDAIRLILALLVIYSHCYPGLRIAHREPWTVLSRGQTTFGELAVLCFFMISGFLITRSWGGSPTARSYISRRVRRIYPGFIAASLICLAVVGPIGAIGHPGYWNGFDPIGFARGLFLLDPHFPQTFHGSTISVVNGSLWTIRWEFLCYLCVPVLAWLGCYRRRSWLLALFVAAIAVFVLKMHFLPGIKFPGKLVTAFMAGQLFYLYNDRIRFRRIYLLGACGLILLAAIAGPLDLYHNFLPVFGSYILFYAAFAESRLLQFVKSLCRGHDISYGVYLYGWPAQGLIGLATRGHLDVHVFFVLSAAAAIILGAISWFLVERHFLARGSARAAATTSPEVIHPYATPALVSGGSR